MFERILVATDGSDCSNRSAQMGIELAKTSHGKVTALYVLQQTVAPIGGLTSGKIDEVVEGMRKAVKEEGESALAQVEEMAKRSGVPMEKKMVEGHPASEILRIAEETPMDVIVMGSIGRTGLVKYLLGSVAEKVVRNSKVPVLLIPAEPQTEKNHTP